MTFNLIGTWKSDPSDEITIRDYGNVVMEFKEDGALIYSIIENDKVQVILMTYEIKEDFFDYRPAFKSTKNKDRIHSKF